VQFNQGTRWLPRLVCRLPCSSSGEHISPSRGSEICCQCTSVSNSGTIKLGGGVRQCAVRSAGVARQFQACDWHGGVAKDDLTPEIPAYISFLLVVRPNYLVAPSTAILISAHTRDALTNLTRVGIMAFAGHLQCGYATIPGCKMRVKNWYHAQCWALTNHLDPHSSTVHVADTHR
jgi:hypothetical protein